LVTLDANVAAPFTWNLEPLSVVVPTNIFPVLTGFNITFYYFQPHLCILHQLQNKLNCIQQYPTAWKSSLKLALPLPKNISLPVVTLDANVAAVPFNVPFKVPPLKGRFSEDSPSNEPKKVGSYYPLLFVVE
jgi:hypothetical protein